MLNCHKLHKLTLERIHHITNRHFFDVIFDLTLIHVNKPIHRIMEHFPNADILRLVDCDVPFCSLVWLSLRDVPLRYLSYWDLWPISTIDLLFLLSTFCDSLVGLSIGNTCLFNRPKLYTEVTPEMKLKSISCVMPAPDDDRSVKDKIKSDDIAEFPIRIFGTVQELWFVNNMISFGADSHRQIVETIEIILNIKIKPLHNLQKVWFTRLPNVDYVKYEIERIKLCHPNLEIIGMFW